MTVYTTIIQRLVLVALVTYCSTFFASDQISKLDIVITKLDEGVVITLEFRGNDTGKTELQFTDWAGLDDMTSHIEDMEVLAKDRTLPVEITGNGQWVVTHDASESLTVSYRILPNNRQLSDSSRQYYRPIINDSLFHATGNNFLPLPQHLAGKVDLSLTWNQFGDWPTITSLGSINNSATFETSIQDIYDSLYVAGTMSIAHKVVNGNDLYVSLHGDSWSFTIDQLAALVERIAQAERDYFDDHDFPFYWVNAIAIGKPIEQGYSFSGTRLHNNFALFLNPSTVFEFDLPTGSPIINLLAHEMMHVWIGGKIKPEMVSEDGTYAWFLEGFTNYFTGRVLLESGLINEQQYVNLINSVLKGYHFNPARDEGNSKIIENFWKSPDFQRLPYQRGELIALAIESLLEKNNLKDMLVYWLNKDKWQTGFELSDFNDAIRPIANSMQYEELNRVITSGGTIDWSYFKDDQCLKLADTSIDTWDPGFDFRTSFKSRLISGVNPESNAYKAGLRDGQNLLGGSIVYDDIVNPVKIQVKERESAIEYIPLGTPVDIIQASIIEPGCLLN